MATKSYSFGSVFYPVAVSAVFLNELEFQMQFSVILLSLTRLKYLKGRMEEYRLELFPN